jgi:hypothetical protein
VEIVVTTLASLIALLLGTLVTKVFQEKKLEKLGDEIKGELKETTRSIIELDNKVITVTPIILYVNYVVSVLIITTLVKNQPGPAGII